jgi:S1-C subfamily serine protease
MTNKHVIDGGAYVQAVDFDGVTHTATVVSVSSTADLAILKIDVTGVESLSFASMGNVGVSDRVIAVGNPLGLSFTVTEGIVSALERQVDSTGIGYVQTDVPINPGNSGGPLVNVDKKVVGINTLGVIGYDGLGFAIPADVVSAFANSV